MHFKTIEEEMEPAAHKHELWHMLVQDVREKAFSSRTFVQLVVGVKISKNEFKAFWGKRSPRGRVMEIMHMTEKIPLKRPTRKYLLLPTRLLECHT